MIRGQTLAALHLRDHFVTPSADAESVHVIAAEEDGQIASGLGHVDALRPQLVAIEHDLRLRLIELQIRIGVHELPARECFADQLVRELGKTLGFRGRNDRHVDGKTLAGAGQRWRNDLNRANARDLRGLHRRVHLNRLNAALPLVVRLGDHAAESNCRKHHPERRRRLGHRSIDVLDLRREQLRLIDRRIRRRLDETEEEALVLHRRELFLRKHVERKDQHDDDRPERQHDRAILERAGQRARVAIAHFVERLIDDARESALRVAGAQQLRSHHRRQSQRDDARHQHRPGQREREFAEQRAGQSTLNRDRRVDRRQRDRHRDDRSDELTRRIRRRLVRSLAHVQMALDVLNHDDRIVDDETDRQHDREQRQQVDRESKREHQKRRADE